MSLMAENGCGALGATPLGGDRCRFCVWAPRAAAVEVRLLGPPERVVPLRRRRGGYHDGTIEGVAPGALYFYRLDGQKERPDPASRAQPQGVHGPSQVVDLAFDWHDGGWHGLPLAEHVFYELHVGTFTHEGTFDAVIPHLDDLKDLGVTAVELMPVAQFPGARNWGYDGVYPFAVQHSYGGPRGLQRLANACHARGLALVLDVVYNHLGPEGNYLWDYGPYFTERYRTPWGAALNFDGPDSDEVRRYFLENARQWQRDFHLDGLRLDAVDSIQDLSPRPFLGRLADTVHREAGRLGRRFHLIAESDRNDVRYLRPRRQGGLGMDAQWSDDFHRALHALLTGERHGYYRDFGRVGQLARAYGEGFVFTGRQYNRYRGRRHGSSSRGRPAEQFVVYAQNHDQVGNRPPGERLSRLVGLAGLKVAAAAVVLSPNLPLLFMGEEHGEAAAFPFFISHGDEPLAEAVRQGRQRGFAHHGSRGAAPDPQAEATFLAARLQRELREAEPHRTLRAFYAELLRLRKATAALARLSKEHLEAVALETEKVLQVRRWAEGSEVLLVLHFCGAERRVKLPAPAGDWRKLLDSAERRWLGAGSELPERFRSEGEVSLALSPVSCALYERVGP
jgi:maltooligosyltrehalose trehalohydrolase